MDKLIWEEKNIKIYHNQGIKIITVIRTEPDEHTPEIYRQYANQLVDLIRLHRPTALYYDNTEFQYSITPEMQTWLDENVVRYFFSYGIKKIAYKVNADIFALVSLEQLYEERYGQTIQVNYFDNETNAMLWLLE